MCEVCILTPLASALHLSSQTKTSPDLMLRRSSASSRRLTIGSMSCRTAWKIIRASAVVLTRNSAMVGCCIICRSSKCQEGGRREGENWKTGMEKAAVLYRTCQRLITIAVLWNRSIHSLLLLVEKC